MDQIENNGNRISLKPYLETIEDFCSRLSREELLELVLALAKDEPASKRMYFLQKLDNL
ncbi:hypothetical protein [uncultured Desulfobacter sp.]|uniref:hypothetical protein n=1 Tax=uncultured Desulfobacter sp. TaxID=240139 RepID=UPI002AAAEC2C|nr:hypothetical protein [uncultured Desulfobacter sp.]